MKKNVLASVALLAVGAMSFLSTSQAQAQTATNKAQQTQTSAKKGAKPAASPGWIVIEEEVWTPLRFEPIETLDSIRYHYRRNEEKAAAGKIDAAVSWLRLAEGHAQPITKEKLTAAANELTTVAKDLRAGAIADAAMMDSALGRAAEALGEWHFYKAKESYGKNEEQDAGRDLAMAANYLQRAANSANYQFGADTQSIITDYFDDGSWIGSDVAVDHNKLGKDLQGIEKAIITLAEKLKKS